MTEAKLAKVVPTEPDTGESKPAAPKIGWGGPANAVTERDIRCSEVVSIFLVCAIPMAATVVAFSLMCFGFDVYSAIARWRVNMIGNGLAVFFAALLCLFFVLDMQQSHVCCRVFAWLISAVVLMLAALGKGMSYPWAAPLSVMLLMPCGLLLLRWVAPWSVIARSQFYRAAGLSALCCTLALLAAWLLWTYLTDYSPDGAQWNQVTKAQLMADSADIYAYALNDSVNYTAVCQGSLGPEVADSVKLGCKRAETVWFVIWMLPFAVVVLGCLVVAFCLLESRIKMTSAKEIGGWIKRFIVFLTCSVFGMYVCIYASGVSVYLASAFMALFAAAILAVVLYAYREIPQEVIANLSAESKDSKLADSLRSVYENDWVRAMVVGSVNVLIPFLLGMDILRQLARRTRGTSTTTGWFTDGGQEIVNVVHKWNWNSILSKVALLGEGFGMSIFGGKFTYIFFSWLNGMLAGVNLGTICLLTFLIHCVLFLNPVIPGAAMYLFAGIVIVSQGEELLGFWGATAVACWIGFMSKIIFASLALYGIGAWMGTSVRIQKFIGVDTVGTRAIERILRAPGFSYGKLAIMTGGPDWPTGVVCGLLLVNVREMLIASVPLFFVGIIPQTLTGSLMTKGSDADTIWSSVTTACGGLAVVVQVGCGVVATRCIVRIVDEEGEELAKPRPEHAKVAELTAKEATYNSAYAQVEAWPGLSARRKFTILLATALQLLAGFLFAGDFVLMDPVCFAEFALNDTIANALGGNALNVILKPVGYVALSIWFVGVCVHIVHMQDLTRAARRLDSSGQRT